MKRIGLALGGGGAKGLAHVLFLEALDEMRIKPTCITGTSIGAIIGVLYCSGVSGRQLRKAIMGFPVPGRTPLKEVVTNKHIFKWLDFIAPQFNGSGLLKAENFIKFLFETIKARTFEELTIPLRVVAADFWTRQEVVLDHGDLLPAVQASMSMPGVFAPVLIGDKVLIDGGAVNPVPFDLLQDNCELTIAIDTIGSRTAGTDHMPPLTDAIFNTFQIMQKSIIREKLKAASPDIYIEPEITDIRVLEFYKAAEIFKQAEPTKQQFKSELEKWLDMRQTAPPTKK